MPKATKAVHTWWPGEITSPFRKYPGNKVSISQTSSVVSKGFVEKAEQSAGLLLLRPGADHFFEKIESGSGGGTDQQVVGQAEGADPTGEEKQKQKGKEFYRLLDDGAEDGRTPFVVDGGLGLSFSQAVDAPDD